jgi:hypothetical protein
MRKHTGWGKGSRPFSETEWKHSWLRHNSGDKDYSSYRKDYNRIVEKKRMRAAPKRRESTGIGLGLFR